MWQVLEDPSRAKKDGLIYDALAAIRQCHARFTSPNKATTCTAQSMMRCVCAARCSSVAALRLVAMRQFLPPPVSGERSGHVARSRRPGGKSRDMRCHVDAWMPPCGVIRRQWLGLEHVEERTAQMSEIQRRYQVWHRDQRAAPRVQHTGAPRQHRNVACINQPARFRGIRQQPHQEVGLCQERLRIRSCPKSTLRQRATFPSVPSRRPDSQVQAACARQSHRYCPGPWCRRAYQMRCEAAQTLPTGTPPGR